MRHLRAILLLLSALLWPGLARAEALVVETFTLRYLTVEEAVPVLRPLVSEQGAVTGMHSQLIVRGTRADLDSVAAVLDQVDRAPRRLVLSVRQERAASVDRRGGSVDARVEAGDVTLSTGRDHRPGPGLSVGGGGERSRADVRVIGTRGRDEGTILQRVQTLEGRAALVRTGQSVPVGERYVFLGPGGAGVADTVRYLDVATGFWVLPRVSGDEVTLELSAYAAQLPARGGGAVATQRADAVLSGRLGEWIEVASTTSAERGSEAGIVYGTRRRDEGSHVILLRVEELP